MLAHLRSALVAESKVLNKVITETQSRSVRRLEVSEKCDPTAREPLEADGVAAVTDAGDLRLRGTHHRGIGKIRRALRHPARLGEPREGVPPT
jgi:hypothetical protein